MFWQRRQSRCGFSIRLDEKWVLSSNHMFINGNGLYGCKTYSKTRIKLAYSRKDNRGLNQNNTYKTGRNICLIFMPKIHTKQTIITSTDNTQ